MAKAVRMRTLNGCLDTIRNMYGCGYTIESVTIKREVILFPDGEMVNYKLSTQHIEPENATMDQLRTIEVEKTQQIEIDKKLEKRKNTTTI